MHQPTVLQQKTTPNTNVDSNKKCSICTKPERNHNINHCFNFCNNCKDYDHPTGHCPELAWCLIEIENINNNNNIIDNSRNININNNTRNNMNNTKHNDSIITNNTTNKNNTTYASKAKENFNNNDKNSDNKNDSENNINAIINNNNNMNSTHQQQRITRILSRNSTNQPLTPNNEILSLKSKIQIQENAIDDMKNKIVFLELSQIQQETEMKAIKLQLLSLTSKKLKSKQKSNSANTSSSSIPSTPIKNININKYNNKNNNANADIERNESYINNMNSKSPKSFINNSTKSLTLQTPTINTPASQLIHRNSISESLLNSFSNSLNPSPITNFKIQSQIKTPTSYNITNTTKLNANKFDDSLQLPSPIPFTATSTPPSILTNSANLYHPPPTTPIIVINENNNLRKHKATNITQSAPLNYINLITPNSPNTKSIIIKQTQHSQKK